MVQTDKTFQSPSREILEAYETLQNVSIRHVDVEIILDFHMFDIQDFDLLIRHSIEKLLRDAPTQDKLEVHLGKETISLQIARATKSMTEPPLDFEPIKEVKGILLVDSPESPGEKYAEEFIKEEDALSKSVDSSEFETPPKPPIEFEPLPSGPEKVVLDHDRDSTAISHDESLEIETPGAMESDGVPTLESKQKDSLDEHGSFILEIPQEQCSLNASPESGMLCAPSIHEDYNCLKVLSCKTFRRPVVDAYVYHKHCRFHGCTAALTLQRKFHDTSTIGGERGTHHQL